MMSIASLSILVAPYQDSIETGSIYESQGISNSLLFVNMNTDESLFLCFPSHWQNDIYIYHYNVWTEYYCDMV